MNDLGFQHVFLPSPSPPGTQPRRTLLLLHGTGGDEHDLIPLGRKLDPAAAILSPRGKVLERAMPRFFRRLAEGVFDLKDLVARTHELAEFVQAASRQYSFDRAGLLALGFSNGANIAASLLFLHPGLLPAAALLAPMVPLVPDTPPDLTGVRIFIGSGALDPIATPRQTATLVGMLRAYGADVTAFEHEDGHTLTQREADHARKWMARL